MAVVVLQTNMAVGVNYTHTVDSSLDYGAVPINTTFYDKTTKQVFFKDSLGEILSVFSGGDPSIPNSNIITSSTQWAKTLAVPVSLPNGALANGWTFFTNADKVAGGTTAYNEFTTAFGISIILSGISGTANINVNGVDYLATFTTNLFTTAQNWVTANQVALTALGIRVFAIGSGAVGQIRFGYETAPLLNAITITNVSGTLSGTKQNTFTGGAVAVQDHLVITYANTNYFGQRILHTIRANFNIATGSVQYASLGLYRYGDSSLIGSTITVLRTPDTTGSQVVLESYTNGASDPFVTGGFYPALVNNTGVTLDFIGSVGILMQNIFQKPTNFQ